MGRTRILLIAGLLLAGWAGSAPAATPEYEAAKKSAFAGKYCCFYSEAPEALGQFWSIVGQQAASFLAAHPQSLDVKADFKTFDPDLRVDTFALTRALTLLTAQNGEIGMAWVIEHKGGSFMVVWTADHASSGALKKFPLLAAWLPWNARTDCGRRAPYGARWECGPSYASGGSLLPDSKGRARFYLDATYAQGAGMGVSAQLSIWQWDGKTAEPLLLVPYNYMIEDAVTRLDGNELHFRQKDEYRTAFVTAPEVGKQMNGVIRVDPGGVRYLGVTPNVPELAFVDDVMWASIQGKIDGRFHVEICRGQTVRSVPESVRSSET